MGQRYVFETITELLKTFEHADVVKAVLSYETGITDVLTLNKMYREYREDDTLPTFLNEKIHQ